MEAIKEKLLGLGFNDPFPLFVSFAPPDKDDLVATLVTAGYPPDAVINVTTSPSPASGGVERLHGSLFFRKTLSPDRPVLSLEPRPRPRWLVSPEMRRQAFDLAKLRSLERLKGHVRAIYVDDELGGAKAAWVDGLQRCKVLLDLDAEGSVIFGKRNVDWFVSVFHCAKSDAERFSDEYMDVVRETFPGFKVELDRDTGVWSVTSLSPTDV